MENKRKHLELIQKIITRMAGNLFYLRGWTITLIAGLLALLAKDVKENPNLLYIVYFPVFICWILDGYFLSQERLFRDLYDHVRKLKEKEIDFSMDTSEFRNVEKNSWLMSMFSKTLLFFYLPLLIIVIVIQILLIR